MTKSLTRLGARWKRRALAAGSLGAATTVAVLMAAGGGAAAAGTGPTAVGTPSTATLVATVDVAELPPPTASQDAVLPLLVPDPAALAAAKAAQSGPAAQRSARPATKPILTPGTQLSGAINASTSMCGCTPPDMGLGVGNGFKMQQVNLAGRVWDSGNNPGTIFSLASFYGTGGDFISDPWVFFDQQSQRWFGGIVDVSKSSERLAVSTSASPTTFKVYDVPQGGSGFCGDQAKIGISDNVVAMSSNVFANFCNGGYLGDRVTVLNKAELVAGASTIDTAAFGPTTKYFSLVPAQSMTATTDQWYAQTNSGSVARIVKTVGTPPASVTLTEVYTPSIRTVAQPPDAQQRGTGTLLATDDDRVDNVVWQSNSLIFTNSEGCTPRGDSFRSCARLLAVDTSTGIKTIDKTRSQAGAYFFYPAVHVDPAGTIVLAYGRSSTSVYPEVDATPANAAGQFGTKKTLVAGTAPNTTGRYGDYFAVAPDPSDATKAWVAGEIGGGSGGWGTAIRQVSLTP